MGVQLAGNDCNDYNAIIAEWENFIVASLTIRNVDEKLKSKLRLEAARHGRSMEEEVRQILRGAVLAGEPKNGGTTITDKIKRRFAGLRADEIELPARRAPRLPPNLKSGR